MSNTVWRLGVAIWLLTLPIASAATTSGGPITRTFKKVAGKMAISIEPEDFILTYQKNRLVLQP